MPTHQTIEQIPLHVYQPPTDHLRKQDLPSEGGQLGVETRVEVFVEWLFCGHKRRCRKFLQNYEFPLDSAYLPENIYRMFGVYIIIIY